MWQFSSCVCAFILACRQQETQGKQYRQVKLFVDIFIGISYIDQWVLVGTGQAMYDLEQIKFHVLWSQIDISFRTLDGKNRHECSSETPFHTFSKKKYIQISLDKYDKKILHIHEVESEIAKFPSKERLRSFPSTSTLKSIPLMWTFFVRYFLVLLYNSAQNLIRNTIILPILFILDLSICLLHTSLQHNHLTSVPLSELTLFLEKAIMRTDQIFLKWNFLRFFSPWGTV